LGRRYFCAGEKKEMEERRGLGSEEGIKDVKWLI